MFDSVKERERFCIIYSSPAQEGFDFSVLLWELPLFARGLRKPCLMFSLYLSFICYR